MTGSPSNASVAVYARSLAALMSVLNLALPYADELVEEGELLEGTVNIATGAFEEISDALDAIYGDDSWLDEPESGLPETLWKTASSSATTPAPIAAAATPAPSTATDTAGASPAKPTKPRRKAPPIRTPDAA